MAAGYRTGTVELLADDYWELYEIKSRRQHRHFKSQYKIMDLVTIPCLMAENSCSVVLCLGAVIF